MNLQRREFLGAMAAAAVGSMVQLPGTAAELPYLDIKAHRVWSQQQFDQGGPLRDVAFIAARVVAARVIIAASVTEVLSADQIIEDNAAVAKLVRQIIVLGDAFVPDRTLVACGPHIYPVFHREANRQRWAYGGCDNERYLSNRIRIRQIRLDGRLEHASLCPPYYHPAGPAPVADDVDRIAELFAAGDFSLQRLLLWTYCSVVRRRIELRYWTLA